MEKQNIIKYVEIRRYSFIQTTCFRQSKRNLEILEYQSHRLQILSNVNAKLLNFKPKKVQSACLNASVTRA